MSAGDIAVYGVAIGTAAKGVYDLLTSRSSNRRTHSEARLNESQAVVALGEIDDVEKKRLYQRITTLEQRLDDLEQELDTEREQRRAVEDDRDAMKRERDRYRRLYQSALGT